jgi:hypothetical protein
VILRELLIAVLAFSAFASAVAAYLFVFHPATASLKEVLSTAFAGMVGVFVGRWVERRMARG